MARKYIQRVVQIQQVSRFNDLYMMRSLRLHRLAGSRAGQFAIDLNNRWRMILTYDEEAEVVRILEVTNHYDD